MSLGMGNLTYYTTGRFGPRNEKRYEPYHEKNPLYTYSIYEQQMRSLTRTYLFAYVSVRPRRNFSQRTRHVALQKRPGMRTERLILRNDQTAVFGDVAHMLL